MDTSTGQVNRDAASVYDEFFVPALFAEWAPRVADTLEPIADGLVLDVACGTGVLGRELARRVGPARVCGVDCNQGMLAVLGRLAPEVDRRLARAEKLPFESGTCAAVGCQFGLMFFEDRVAALSEMWRVLAPGGRLAVAVWGALADTPGYDVMAKLLHSLFGEAIASQLRAPFCLGDRRALAELFESARIPRPQLRTIVGRARFPSIEAWIHTDVRGWTLADRIDDQEYALLKREAPSALAAHALQDGSVEFASPAHIISAQKP
jgi:ubiquinone/menaquinone biosynthesis C-methylase UbiE